MTDVLLAKSFRSPAEPIPRFARLLEHSRDVAVCCDVLFDSVGDAALRAMDIGSDRRAYARRTLIACGWMQDAGKANSHFQQLVTSSPDIRQLIRHEHVSGMLFWLHPTLGQWAAELGQDVHVSAVWAALGHHRKFHQDTRPSSGVMQVHLEHADFRRLLVEMAADLGLGSPPLVGEITVVDVRPSGNQLSAAAAFTELRSDFFTLEERFRAEETRRELALVKGLGICADVAASALGRLAPSSAAVGDAARELLDVSLTGDDIERLIRQWAWRELENEHIANPTARPAALKLRDFQSWVAQSEATVTLAEAGCGSGKSLAAYLWAKGWSERRAAEGRKLRLFFCLPTTGTTTEHFKDYALECGVDSSLAHSRAKVDLSYLAETAPQEDGEEAQPVAEAAQAALGAMRAKVDALALWSTPLAVCTTDTVLGIMANARKSICAFPAIVQSAIVFDEVHAFDDVLFGHLLVFLKHFPGIPVLLMTASLPRERREALRSVRPDMEIIPGPEELEMRRRHVIRIETTPTPWDEIARSLDSGERVLWVCNQVERANERWEKARARFGHEATVQLYHSRYKYKDRSRLHRRVIDTFKNPTGGVLLVATQVAEMSLDLSADLLVTDRAPVPSLIQRLGRHRRKDDDKGPGVVLVCELPNEKGAAAPYGDRDLRDTDGWLSTLVGRAEGVHQRDLLEAFSRLPPRPEVDIGRAERACGFIGYPGHEGLWRTAPGTTRADGYTVSVVFPSDLAACTELVNGLPTAEWFRGHEVSVSLRAGMERWNRLGGVLVASDALSYEFDETTLMGRGARWS